MKNLKIVKLSILTFMLLVASVAQASVDEYWQKISLKKSPDVLKIYKKRVANLTPDNKFIKQSLLYLTSTASYYDWKSEVVNDLLAKVDEKEFSDNLIKDSVETFIKNLEAESRYLSLRSFLEVLVFKNEKMKISESFKLSMTLKLAEVYSALLLYSEADAVFIKHVGEKNIDLDFWKLYSYAENLINMGKIDKVPQKIQLMTALAKSNDKVDQKQQAWIFLLESKLLLQSNELESAFKKAETMKSAFEKLDQTNKKISSYPLLIYSIVARRFNKIEEALSSIQLAESAMDNKSSSIERFWCRLSRLKIQIKKESSVGPQLLSEVDKVFRPFDGTELKGFYNSYETVYRKLAQNQLLRSDVDLAFGKSINFFENQEVISFLEKSASK